MKFYNRCREKPRNPIDRHWFGPKVHERYIVNKKKPKKIGLSSYNKFETRGSRIFLSNYGGPRTRRSLGLIMRSKLFATVVDAYVHRVNYEKAFVLLRTRRSSLGTIPTIPEKERCASPSEITTYRLREYCMSLRVEIER